MTKGLPELIAAMQAAENRLFAQARLWREARVPAWTQDADFAEQVARDLHSAVAAHKSAALREAAKEQAPRVKITVQEAWDAYERATYGKIGNTIERSRLEAVDSFLRWMLGAAAVASPPAATEPDAVRLDAAVAVLEQLQQRGFSLHNAVGVRLDKTRFIGAVTAALSAMQREKT